MSDESLWAITDWLHVVTDVSLVAYKALVVVVIIVFVILIIAEIANIYR